LAKPKGVVAAVEVFGRPCTAREVQQALAIEGGFNGHELVRGIILMLMNDKVCVRVCAKFVKNMG
jgi:hypothetical protein